MASLPKVVHLAEDIDVSAGGVISAIKDLAACLAQHGVRQELIGAGPTSLQFTPGMAVRQLAVAWWGRSWRYAPGMRAAVLEAARDGNCVLQMYGVWKAPQYLGARWSVGHGIPAILSPRNMLGTWCFNWDRRRTLQKLVYWHLLARHALSRATVIHALTSLERDELRACFPSQRVVVIPNTVDLQALDAAVERSTDPDPGSPGPLPDDYLLFLGRLHPVKGIENLIDAYASLKTRRKPGLIIAGPAPDPAYRAALEARARAAGAGESIEFIGAVHGPRKWALFRHARAVCAPSYSEGMSNVALESMAASVPLITTFAAGLHEIEDGGGLLIHPQVGELAAALADASSWGQRERLDRGRAARALVERRYSWQVVAPQWLALYAELAGGAGN